MRTANNMDLQDEMIRTCRLLFQKGLATSTSGNLSARVDDGIVLTATGVSLADVTEQNLARTDLAGNVSGSVRPTKELGLHLAIYNRHPDARVVIHVHPAHCIAVSAQMDLNREQFLPAITPQSVMRAGRVPVVPYFPPGSAELAQAVENCPARSAVALQNHGLVVFAAEFVKAIGILEEIEDNCRVRLLAGPSARTLTQGEIDLLLKRVM
ncbi:MAG: class II aldolase/adducin family protein [Planctomycetes bacterium]|nr:class II aldolase/adducin family protein [Planctomycetota bacterium]